MFSQIKLNPQLFNDPEEEFSIELPRGFTVMAGEQREQFNKRNAFLLGKKLDRFDKLYVFNDQERLLVIKLYRNTAPANSDNARALMERFASKFNEKMKKFQKPFNVEYESYVIHEKLGRKFTVYYGNGNFYLDNSSFIQAVLNDEYKRTFIIYGFLKKSEKNALDTIFINSILSIQPKEPRAVEENQQGFNPLKKKWFRYLILLVVAVAVTVLYNRFAKQKIAIFDAKEYEKKNQKSPKS